MWENLTRERSTATTASSCVFSRSKLSRGGGALLLFRLSKKKSHLIQGPHITCTDDLVYGVDDQGEDQAEMWGGL